MENKEKFECGECGCFFWVEDRNNFTCPNCEDKRIEINKIYQMDVLKGLSKIPDDYVDLVVTSPPYNKSHYFPNKTATDKDSWKQRNITYGDFKDNLEPGEYEKWQRKILMELLRVLKPNGSIFYNHKSFNYKHKLIFPTYVFDFNVRQMIIWNRGNTPQLDNIRFFPITEYIFWITKEPATPIFDRKKALFDKDIWRINARVDKEHPATFPIELAKNCILTTTKKGMIVLDPFIGSGTTAIACKQLGRNYIGFEINSEYIKIAKKRLAQKTLLQEVQNR